MYHVRSLPTDQSTLPGTKQKKNTRLPVEVGWLFYFKKASYRGRSRMGLERSSKFLFYPIQSY